MFGGGGGGGAPGGGAAAAAAAAGGDDANPLAYLRNNPQFAMLRAAVQANPQMLVPLLQVRVQGLGAPQRAMAQLEGCGSCTGQAGGFPAATACGMCTPGPGPGDARSPAPSAPFVPASPCSMHCAVLP